jgi:hypothetical protein
MPVKKTAKKTTKKTVKMHAKAAARKPAKKTARNSTIALIVCLLSFLSVFSCSRPPAKQPPPSKAVSQLPAVRTGTLTFVTGTVAVMKDKIWISVTVGDSVAEDAVVKTAGDSSCEIQFGQTGIIHVAENTTLVLRTAVISEAHKAVDLELTVGSVTAKVAKLAIDDHFQVRTDAVVCGVRGTKFNVEKSADETTTVAVAEGKVALMPPSFDPVSLENASVSPTQSTLVADAAEKVAEDSPVVVADAEVVVTKATMTKADAAVAQVVAVLSPGASAPTVPGAGKTLPPSVAQALDSYANAVPKTSEVAPKPLGADAQRTFQETASLQILETLPAAPPQPRTPLSTPKAVTPAPDTQIDINKNDSIRFTWEAVPNAASYQVDIFKISAGTKTLVKSLTTSDLSIVYDQFAKLGLGSFSWEVSALPSDSDQESQKSAPSVSSFEIIKAGTLQAPSINKLPAPVIKTPGNKSSGSTP